MNQQVRQHTGLLAPSLLQHPLGAGTSAMNDQRRWRRAERARSRKERAALYAEYLTALEDTGHELLTVLRTAPPHERPTAAETAFTAYGLGAVRHRIHVLAPASVTDAADAVFRAVRNSRGHVATADPGNEPALESLKAEIGDLRDRLKPIMRHDITTMM
ncbi:hypothetical protein ACFY15_32930 [Streptomyces sp. NPDC001373]|uniref:hypothetical protein n=1 Tax=Streptomyces sp. NPDC001373 TaxID=3364565 RepID=UPI0036982D91